MPPKNIGPHKIVAKYHGFKLAQLSWRNAMPAAFTVY
jgi:hypothetical protein